MNNLRNKVQLIGHLGQAPEVISFDSGNKLAKMTLATNETYKNAKGDKITDTQWHNLIAWGKTAEIIEKHLGKGQEVAIEGKLITKSYETKAGEKRYRTEIQVSELLMLG
ncbi:MAG: single-stranded DNA-binding protein, partial [Putridiphycobacter sp.]|nr:single-stranded DNA-binding protein [Putridiphycobacter sp.]